MKCPKCSKENKENAKVCRRCGKFLNKTPEPSERTNFTYDWKPLVLTILSMAILIIIVKFIFKV